MKKTLILALTALTLTAQTQATSKQAMLMAAAANGKQAVSCQWKQKITVIRKGTPMEPRIEEIRLDAFGQPVRTTLAQPAERKMGPLKSRKVAEVREDIQEVMELARRYANPQMFRQIVEKAEIWEGPGTIRLQARSVLMPADEINVNVNRRTLLASRLDCRTHHEGDPVIVAVDYEQPLNGPSMMKRMTVQMPKDEIIVNVESYDFVRLAGSNLQ